MVSRENWDETKGRFRKGAALANVPLFRLLGAHEHPNVPSFRFLIPTREHPNVPLFRFLVPGNIRQNHGFFLRAPERTEGQFWRLEALVPVLGAQESQKSYSFLLVALQGKTFGGDFGKGQHQPFWKLPFCDPIGVRQGACRFGGLKVSLAFLIGSEVAIKQQHGSYSCRGSCCFVQLLLQLCDLEVQAVVKGLSPPKSQRFLRFAIAMPIADPRNRAISETRQSNVALRFRGAMESR